MSFFKNILGGHHGRGNHGGGKHHSGGHGAEQYDRHGRQQGCDGGNQVYDGGRPPTPAPIKDLQGCRQCRTANDPSARFCLNC